MAHVEVWVSLAGGGCVAIPGAYQLRTKDEVVTLTVGGVEYLPREQDEAKLRAAIEAKRDLVTEREKAARKVRDG